MEIENPEPSTRQHAVSFKNPKYKLLPQPLAGFGIAYLTWHVLSQFVEELSHVESLSIMVLGIVFLTC